LPSLIYVGGIGFAWLRCFFASVARVCSYTLSSFGSSRLAMLASAASVFCLFFRFCRSLAKQSGKP